MSFREIVSDILGYEISLEDMDSPLEEIGIDSVKLWHIIAELEEIYNVEFEIEEVAEFSQSLKCLESLLNEKVGRDHGRIGEKDKGSS